MKSNQEEKEGLLFKQSSELEILISAAIVFAAVSIYDVVPKFITGLLNYNINDSSVFLVIVAILALFLGVLLPVSILCHFILRFYWLALLGLKTTYDRPNWSNLNFADKYIQHLKKSYDLDRSIIQIDRVCSSIFAFSFLTAAMFCFTSISLVLIFSVVNAIIGWTESELLIFMLQAIMNLVFLMCLLALFDFFTYGFLKSIKKKWFVKIYYPIYRFISFITFARLYRGLYYTFITNVPKYVTAIALPLYLVIAVFFLNLGMYESRLYAEDAAGINMGEYALMHHYYEDSFIPEDVLTQPFISSYIIENNMLQVSYPLTEEIDDALILNCDGVQQINNRGMHWRKWLKTPLNRRKIPENFDYNQNAKNALECFSNSISIFINDSLYANQQFRFKMLNSPQKIILTTPLDISNLPSGEHVIAVQLKEPLNPQEYTFAFYKMD